jgi:hypothetical protein
MLNVVMVLGLLTLVTFVAAATRRVRLPYPTLMVLSGLAVLLLREVDADEQRFRAEIRRIQEELRARGTDDQPEKQKPVST